MATAVAPATKNFAGTRSRRVGSLIFVWLAVACTLVAVLGFVPTYWLQVPAGTFVGAPIVHLHAALSTGWMLFLVMQTYLVARGRLRRHRDWGLAGIALATLVVVVDLATAVISLRERLARGEGDAARMFLATPFAAMMLFALFTGAAIACTHRPEWHKRLMIAGTVALVSAAGARVAFLLAMGRHPGLRPGVLPPPPELMPTVVGLVLQLIVVAGMIHDRTGARLALESRIWRPGLTGSARYRRPD